MIRPHYLAVDVVSVMQNIPNGVDDEQYRRIALTGSSYTEKSLREWVHRVWHIELSAPLGDVISAAAKGGWIVYQTPGIPYPEKIPA